MNIALQQIVKEDSIFVADSHYNSNRQELRQFLLQIKSGEIKTNQLFLMGDIFDFLSNEISYFKEQNKEIINFINELSKKIEIIYLEGNHDFNLQKLFPNILVIPRQKQPFICNYKDKKIALAHGDIFMNFKYNLFTKIIRNKLILVFLNIIDKNNWLTKKINNWLLEKNIFNKCTDFEKFAKKRKTFYSKNIDIIIEGHFHYGKQYENYINIPSLACDKQYFIIKDKIFKKLNL